MSRRKKTHKPPGRRFGPRDGSSPRFGPPSADRRKPHRKTYQLCGQVAQTLNFVLWGECNDDLLRTVYVSSVEPAPDTSRLMVTVKPQLAGTELDVPELLGRLEAVKGLLRSEVASSIHRRKTPDLIFRVEPNEESLPEQSQEPN